MARKKRSKTELKNASEHVCYEIWMLHHIGRSLATGLTGKGPIHNAFINSFAVHVRNLVDFLYEAKSDAKSDAILAEDYFRSADGWTSIRPDKTDVLKQAEIRCAKQVAHLTYTRHRKEPWHFVGIVQDLLKALRVFMTNVDRTLLEPHIRPIQHLFEEN